MRKQRRVLKYRWVVLLAVGMSGLLALLIALGVPLREGVTPAIVLVPLPILLVALAPLSVAKVIKHRWGMPIASTWGSASIIAIHFGGTRLMGFGHQCDEVVLTTCIVGFCFINATWAIGELRQWRARDKPKINAAVLQQGLLPS